MENWIEDKKEPFVNPYNFVPFEKAIRRPIEGLNPGDLTGVITCGITLLTPLFIPNTSNSHALHEVKGDKDVNTDKEGKSYDFFSYQNLSGKDYNDILKHPYEPVIPGSEIRGAVRSVYEAAFQGCASQVDLERVLERRSMKAKNAGILKKENGEWKIVKCERLMLNVGKFKDEVKFGKYIKESQYVEWKEGEKLYVKKSKKAYEKCRNGKSICTDYHVVIACEKHVSDSRGWLNGYLHKGESFRGGKHHESVFVPFNKADSRYKCVKVAEKAVEYLEKMIYNYHNKSDKNDSKSKKEKILYPEYEVNDKKETLVYYLLNEKNEACYLSPACIGKEIFQQKFKDLLRNHDVLPCETRKAICPACELFGMAAKEKNEDGFLGSRVRFEDAELTEKFKVNYKEYYDPALVLPEMGEPKPGAVEFYTLPPTEKNLKGYYNYWTYDYRTEGNKRIFFKDDSQEKLKLRGRKFYWHCDAWKPREKDQLSNMRQKIRPLKVPEVDPENEFSFKIYFENITLLELQQLCWALDFNDEKCAHKIGRAKPLGFGSVKIAIQHVELRKISVQTGQRSMDKLDKNEWKNQFKDPQTKSIAALKHILNWNKDLVDKVCYPKAEAEAKMSGPNQKASHQWFKGNRDMGKSQTFYKVLPKIEEEISNKGKLLYKLKEDDKKPK